MRTMFRAGLIACACVLGAGAAGGRQASSSGACSHLFQAHRVSAHAHAGSEGWVVAPTFSSDALPRGIGAVEVRPYLETSVRYSIVSCEPQKLVVAYGRGTMEAHRVGGAAETYAGLEGVVGGLVASVAAQAGSSLEWNGGVGRRNEDVSALAAKLTVPPCRVFTASVRQPKRVVELVHPLHRLRAVCARSDGQGGALFADAVCETQAVVVRAEAGDTPLVITDCGPVPGCDCDGDGGGGGPGVETPCVEIVSFGSGHEVTGGIVHIGEELLPILGPNPCLLVDGLPIAWTWAPGDQIRVELDVRQVAEVAP